MATLHVALPLETNFMMQDDLPSPATHRMTCFGCAFSRPALQYQILEDEEKEKVGNVRCLPANSKWRSLVNSASMKKRTSVINGNKPDFSYDLRSYNLNFEEENQY